MIQILWNTVWRFPYCGITRLKTELPYDLAILLLGIYLAYLVASVVSDSL